MATLRTTLRTGRSATKLGTTVLRALMLFLALCLAWLQVSPAYASSAALARENTRRAAWEVAHRPKPLLPPGLTLASYAALRAKQAAQEAAQAAKPVADVRPLTAAEMGRALGRGPYRVPSFSGSLPWQRSLRDVNLCNGNLFKSFTDVQVAPAHGAGLVLQRTYNSNDARVGPFGVGWTHAYDIRMQEAAQVTAEDGEPAILSDANMVPRTDFFGHKHSYHRDADGLYSPPPYLFDETSSDYGKFLVNGPTQVLDDTEKGMDGTVKHYFSNGSERDCDYIQDRHGNKTVLAYNQAITLPDGRHPLQSVTDPSGRALTFQWSNVSTSVQPAWRIVEVDAPTDPRTGSYAYRVTYGYYTNTASPNAANELYNLKTVTLDPDGLSRTTTFTYTGFQGSLGVETGLLASVSDPLGHVVTYAYNTYPNGAISFGVTQITEPGGVDVNSAPRTHSWSIPSLGSDLAITSSEGGRELYFSVAADVYGRFNKIEPEDDIISCSSRGAAYDNSSNVIYQEDAGDTQGYRADAYTYGPHGNVLTHSVVNGGIGDFETGDTNYSGPATMFAGQETTTYYNADRYFQKQSFTDMDGHVTTTDYYNNLDANLGNRGEVKLVQDAGYNDPTSPSYQKQFTYTYNQYGQKTSETNLNGGVTQYTYGDAWGNLTQVVQDTGGAGHLNRTTTMSYDVMGRVLSSTDPSGQSSTFTYNSLGQPLAVATPAKGSAPAETITYVYDGNGRTHSVTDNRGMTVMAYEAGCDRVHSVTDPVTGTLSYSYNLLGVRTSLTLPDGHVWTYSYLTSARTSQANDPQEYLMAGDDNPDHVSTLLGSISDDQGRRVDYNIQSDGRLLSEKATLSAASSLTTNDTCDEGGQYNNMSHGWLSEIKTTWTGSGQRSSINRIIAQNDYTYDNSGLRLTNTTSTQPANADGSGQTDGSNNPILTSRQEKYEKPDGSSGYDDLNRLTNVDYGDGETQTYAFDPMGNRLTKTDTAGGTTNTTASAFDAANRLTSTALNGGSASAVTSDADGNTVTDSAGRANVWDSQNRLVSCTKAGVTSSYTYGADGLRRSSTVNGVTTYYVYDGQTMVREMKRNAQTGALYATATYLQGPHGGECRVDETQQTEGYVNASGQAQARGVTRWYVYDGLGSVLGEVAGDAVGTVSSSPRYDVYGAVRANAGTASTRQGFVGALGHVSDTETGLVYMRARYYDPSVGRFTSEDPKQEGINWFVYCADNPINDTDYSGEMSDADLHTLLVFLIGIIGKKTFDRLVVWSEKKGLTAGDLVKWLNRDGQNKVTAGEEEAADGGVEAKIGDSMDDIGAPLVKEGGETIEDGVENIGEGYAEKEASALIENEADDIDWRG